MKSWLGSQTELKSSHVGLHGHYIYLNQFNAHRLSASLLPTRVATTAKVSLIESLEVFGKLFAKVSYSDLVPRTGVALHVPFLQQLNQPHLGEIATLYEVLESLHVLLRDHLLVAQWRFRDAKA